MPKILFLGGSQHQLSPICYAKERGYQTIVCDYTPECAANAVADEVYPISTTDMDAVLALAEEKKIDGIVAYASDPAAPTAAWVAANMGLPGNPYQSVAILTNKDLYRQFLKDNGFNTPETYSNCDFLNLPVVVKPVDSSGSKGVRILHDLATFPEALKYSESFSRSGKVIVEEFIKREGRQIAGDGFVVDGKLEFTCFANEHFDPDDGIVPVGESFPYLGNVDPRPEIQRLIDLLGIRNGALNFDIISSDGKIYLMEVGPRNGGCLIPEVTKHHCGVDMIAATVESALGNKVVFPEPANNGFYASYMIHSSRRGIFKLLEIDPSIQIVEANFWTNGGDLVKSYQDSSCTLGNMIVKFDSAEDMIYKMDRMRNFVRVSVI